MSKARASAAAPAADADAARRMLLWQLLVERQMTDRDAAPLTTEEIVGLWIGDVPVAARAEALTTVGYDLFSLSGYGLIEKLPDREGTHYKEWRPVMFPFFAVLSRTRTRKGKD